MDQSLRSALLEQLETKQADAERIAASFKNEDGKFVISNEQHRDYVAAVRAAEEVKSVLDAARSHDELGTYLSNPDGESAAATDAGTPLNAGMEQKSLGDFVVESDAFQRVRGDEGMSNTTLVRASMEGKSLFNFSAGNIPSMQALGSIQELPLRDIQRRKMHIRDLFPKATTRASGFWGVRELGWVNNAAQVKQRYAADGVSPATGTDTDVFGLAPKSKLLLGTVFVPVAEVAHTLDAHKNILSDDNRLRTFINTRMIEGVKYREDFDLLHSVGDGERITGLFNTPGVQTYSGLATDKNSVQVRRAITKALLAEYEPTGLVVSPTMWESVEVEEDLQGNFRIATSVAIGATKTVWRLNVVETTAIEDEKFLLGAFGMGAQLWDREAVSVSASSENRDNYERGVITFRADERLALEVPRPESFVIGTWTDYTG